MSTATTWLLSTCLHPKILNSAIYIQQSKKSIPTLSYQCLFKPYKPDKNVRYKQQVYRQRSKNNNANQQPCKPTKTQRPQEAIIRQRPPSASLMTIQVTKQRQQCQTATLQAYNKTKSTESNHQISKRNKIMTSNPTS